MNKIAQDTNVMKRVIEEFGKCFVAAAIWVALSLGTPAMAEGEKVRTFPRAASVVKAVKKFNPITAIKDRQLNRLLQKQEKVLNKLKGAEAAKASGADNLTRISQLQEKAAVLEKKVQQSPRMKELQSKHEKITKKIEGAKLGFSVLPTESATKRISYLQQKANNLQAKMKPQAPALKSEFRGIKPPPRKLFNFKGR